MILSGLICFSMVAVSRIPPDLKKLSAAKIFESMCQAYSDIKTYQCDYTWVYRQTEGKATGNRVTHINVQATNQKVAELWIGKGGLENPKRMKIITNEDKIYSLDLDRNQFSIGKRDMNGGAVDSAYVPLMYFDSIKPSRLKRLQDGIIEGKPVFIILDPSENDKSDGVRMLVDKKTLRLRKISSGKGNSSNYKQWQNEVVNAPIPKEVFEFKPPVGAKQVPWAP